MSCTVLLWIKGLKEFVGRFLFVHFLLAKECQCGLCTQQKGFEWYLGYHYYMMVPSHWSQWYAGEAAQNALNAKVGMGRSEIRTWFA